MKNGGKRVAEKKKKLNIKIILRVSFKKLKKKRKKDQEVIFELRESEVLKKIYISHRIYFYA